MIETEAPTTPAEKDKAVQEALKTIEKEHGKGSIVLLGERVGVQIPSIPTGIYDLDYRVLQCGGLPKGRIVEIYGPECVDGHAFIQYSVWSGTKRLNHKGGSIARLYERFYNLKPQGDGRGKSRGTQSARYTAPSINSEGRVVQNTIRAVVKSGQKECFMVTTEGGHTIKATAEHKFFVGSGYQRLGDLRVGNTVYVHNRTPFTKPHALEAARRYIYVKHHSVAGTKTTNGYAYKRLRRSRAVVEAWLNGMSLTAYITRLNKGPLDGLQFLPRTVHVHHKDENAQHDVMHNLKSTNASAHGRLHATERHNNLRFVTIPTTIRSIQSCGVCETYDLSMQAPNNNYIVNGFVVHNSGGKTTLSLLAVASAQRAGGRAAFIDVEHALDPTWASLMGVDVDALLVSQPDYGEQALQIVETLLGTYAFDIIVVDSVAALVPKSELDGEIGDATMGAQARMMSQACRKLTALVSKSGTCLIFINQVRDKIGVMFGSPETTTGGRALKFYASVRIDVRRIGTVKEGDEPVGNKVKIKAAKNKCGAPFRECELNLMFNKGFDADGSLFDAAIAAGLVEKSGSWFSYKGNRIGQGRNNAIQTLRDNNHLTGILADLREKDTK